MGGGLSEAGSLRSVRHLSYYPPVAAADKERGDRDSCWVQFERHHAAIRAMAVRPFDLEGNSGTTVGACKDAQTMQRGGSTGAREIASRVFNVE